MKPDFTGQFIRFLIINPPLQYQSEKTPKCIAYHKFLVNTEFASQGQRTIDNYFRRLHAVKKKGVTFFRFYPKNYFRRLHAAAQRRGERRGRGLISKLSAFHLNFSYLMMKRERKEKPGYLIVHSSLRYSAPRRLCVRAF